MAIISHNIYCHIWPLFLHWRVYSSICRLMLVIEILDGNLEFELLCAQKVVIYIFETSSKFSEIRNKRPSFLSNCRTRREFEGSTATLPQKKTPPVNHVVRHELTIDSKFITVKWKMKTSVSRGKQARYFDAYLLEKCYVETECLFSFYRIRKWTFSRFFS